MVEQVKGTHTPGPWRSKVDGYYPDTEWSAENDTADMTTTAAIVDHTGETVALAVMAGLNDPELEGNAALIAAAPDLLERLLESNRFLQTSLPIAREKAVVEKQIEANNATIKKATGEGR